IHRGIPRCAVRGIRAGAGAVEDGRSVTRTAVAGACFERTLLARPGREADTSTRVTWIQGEHLYCDLRQPAGLAARGMRDTTLDDLLALAQQEGFAGPLLDRGDHVEWVRTV